MQTGMKLDSKTPECRKFLIKLMDQLESVSPALRDLFSQSRLCHMSRVRLPLTFYNLNVLGFFFFLVLSKVQAGSAKTQSGTL